MFVRCLFVALIAFVVKHIKIVETHFEQTKDVFIVCAVLEHIFEQTKHENVFDLFVV